MGNINNSRVLIGGLVAGIVFLVLDFAGMYVTGIDYEAWGTAHGLTQPPMWFFIAWDILLGIMVVWLYAAIRPRFGPGARTALLVAGFVWLLVTMIFASFTYMGLFESDDFVKMAAWGVVQCVVATLAGAWLYREKGEMVQT